MLLRTAIPGPGYYENPTTISHSIGDGIVILESKKIKEIYHYDQMTK